MSRGKIQNVGRSAPAEFSVDTSLSRALQRWARYKKGKTIFKETICKQALWCWTIFFPRNYHFALSDLIWVRASVQSHPQLGAKIVKITEFWNGNTLAYASMNIIY